MRARHTLLPILIATIMSTISLTIVTLTVGNTVTRHPPAHTPAAAAVAAAPVPPAGTPAGTPTPPVPVLPAEAWISWAYRDADGHTATGAQPGTSSAESMIKPGIAADFLHGLEAAHREPTDAELNLLTRMIRDSDDQAAETLYRAAGGDKTIKRIVAGCELHDTGWSSGWWSKTEMSAADATRFGACIRDARLVSPRWTGWILEQMRQVRGEGRFGIIEARPADDGIPVAIKNGWTWREDGKWHVNCLAVTDRWTLAVLTRYPSELGLAAGADICRTVAVAVLPPGRARFQ